MKLLKLLITLTMLIATMAKADGFEPSILSPSSAFKVAPIATSGQLYLNFTIFPGYYVYKDRIHITTTPDKLIAISKIKYPKGKFIDGGEGKLEEVLGGTFTIELPFNPNTNFNQLKHLQLTVQGCNGKSICYPPYTYEFDFNQVATTSKAIASDNVTSINHTSKSSSFKEDFKALYQGEINGIQLLNRLTLIQILILFLLAGILIGLTPCMYPLYPIALSTIIGSRESNKFSLSIVYIHGMAFLYVLIGIITSISGKYILTQIQAPAFSLVAAAIIILLGLSMFDLIEIQLPHKLQTKISQQAMKFKGGSYIGAFAIGIFSGAILGPCITPPLIVCLELIAGSQNIMVGILGLYMMALGLGIPILILATLGNWVLPKSGYWMNLIKHLVGIVIVIFGIILAYPFVNVVNPQVSIGLICIITALVFLIIKRLRPRSLNLMIHKVVPSFLLLFGLIFMFYGFSNLNNHNGTSLKPNFIVVTKPSRLKELINTSNKPVIIDFYASWCALCHEMDNSTFSDPKVIEKLNNFEVIRFDLTDNTKEMLDVLASYKLYGPPAMVIIDKMRGKDEVLTGFLSSDKLISKLNQIN